MYFYSYLCLFYCYCTFFFFFFFFFLPCPRFWSEEVKARVSKTYGFFTYSLAATAGAAFLTIRQSSSSIMRFMIARPGLVRAAVGVGGAAAAGVGGAALQCVGELTGLSG